MLIIYLLSVMASLYFLYNAALADFGYITVLGCVMLVVLAMMPLIGFISAIGLWASTSAAPSFKDKVVFRRK